MPENYLFVTEEGAHNSGNIGDEDRKAIQSGQLRVFQEYAPPASSTLQTQPLYQQYVYDEDNSVFMWVNLPIS